MTGAVALACVWSALSAAQPWELRERRGNVEVYTREEPGSAYRAFKAFTEVDASADEVLAILHDVAAYDRWFGYAERVELLRAEGSVRTLYMETRFPWPFDNQDMVYRLETHRHTHGARLTLDGEPDGYPQVPGVHRMSAAQGTIEVVDIAGGRTQVTYRFHAELSGAIPAWLANRHIHELPLKTLVGLRARLAAQNASPINR